MARLRFGVMSANSQTRRTIQPSPILLPMLLILCPLAAQLYGSEIHDALWPDQDLTKAKKLLEANPKLVHSRDGSQRVPLHIAARFGPVDIVEWLLDHGSDVNAVAYNGFTPMHLVSDPEIARRLIKAGADLDQSDNWGSTPLQELARYNRNTAVIDVIIDSGHKIDLASAVMLGKRDLAKRMVKDDPTLLDRAGGGDDLWGCKTPLGIAAGQGDTDLVKFFLEAGASVDRGTHMPNAGGDATALCNAVWGKHEKVVRLLIEYGATTDATGGKYYPTILDYAHQHSSKEIQGLLNSVEEVHPEVSQTREPGSQPTKQPPPDGHGERPTDPIELSPCIDEQSTDDDNQVSSE